jgi:hypothetical protein
MASMVAAAVQSAIRVRMDSPDEALQWMIGSKKVGQKPGAVIALPTYTWMDQRGLSSVAGS